MLPRYNIPDLYLIQCMFIFDSMELKKIGWINLKYIYK